MRRLGRVPRLAETRAGVGAGIGNARCRRVFAGHESQLQTIGEEVRRLEQAAAGGSEPLELSAFRSTWHKLAQTMSRLRRLTEIITRRNRRKRNCRTWTVSLFLQVESMNPRLLAGADDIVLAGACATPFA